MEQLLIQDFKYAAFVAAHYCLPYDCRDQEAYKQAAQDNAYVVFRPWFKDISDSMSDQYELFKSSKRIQEALEAYQLEPFKFWVLFLFIKTFTDHCFENNISHEDSSRQACQHLINTIDINNSFWHNAPSREKNGHPYLTITNGKNKYTTDDPFIMDSFVSFLEGIQADCDDTIHRLKISENLTDSRKIAFMELCR